VNRFIHEWSFAFYTALGYNNRQMVTSVHTPIYVIQHKTRPQSRQPGSGAFFIGCWAE
jgi:hypothetical protein